MSGSGNRFIEGGFDTPKPLILIDDKPMIEHVCNLFPQESRFTFICNSDHLNNTSMRETLLKIKPNSTIVEIPSHKLGPVYAVTLISDLVEDDEEVIVNYCDFGTYWDYQDFLKHTRSRSADGAVVSYKGFHPHMLGSTNYAFIRDKNQWMLEIKEKEAFTNNRMNEYASNGTYYFKKGLFVKKYFQKLIDLKLDLNGEYYVSLVYNLMLQDKLSVSIYSIQHMLQWGTPEDVFEYNHWSNYFTDAISIQKRQSTFNGTCLIPLAGQGARFQTKGYSLPKPLLAVSSKPMIIQATNSLPNAYQHVFVCLQDHLQNFHLEEALITNYPNAKIVQLETPSQGQAISCSKGLSYVNPDAPLLVGATDNAIIYNDNHFQKLIADPELDAIIWTFKDHPTVNYNPEMYGWVEVKNSQATNISVKKSISNDPSSDHAITGIFYFKKSKYFQHGLDELLKSDTKINNEFYIDSLMNELIKDGYNVKVFQVDHYICWGTPEDYETFLYWQSYFHKCPTHPYFLQKDPTIISQETLTLDSQFRDFSQEFR